MASVNVQRRGESWRLRWRETVLEDGRPVRKQRSATASSASEADRMRLEILVALESEGAWSPEPEPEPEPLPISPKVVEPGDLEEAAAAWLRHKASRCREGTRRKYASNLMRFIADVRLERGIADDELVPVSVLSRDLFSRLALRWKAEELSQSTRYALSRIALDVWRWAADEPAEYPQTPPPPHISSRVLARPPVYVAPVAPTLEELDACLRRISPSSVIAWRTAVVMRYTGLRAGQVLAIQAGDVDFATSTLRVRIGKSRREQAAQRAVPLSPHLVAHLRSWLASSSAEDLVVPRRKAKSGSRYVPSPTLRAAWEAATEAGEARREVWCPPTRKQARPDHAFRAAFQAFMESKGVREAVIDHLVGHAPQSVRGKHYAPATEAQLEEAVRLLPAIDWAAPAAANVVSLR